MPTMASAPPPLLLQNPQYIHQLYNPFSIPHANSSYVGQIQSRPKSTFHTTVAAGATRTTKRLTKSRPSNWQSQRSNRYSHSVYQDINTLCRYGHLEEAVRILMLIDSQDIALYSRIYDVLLQACFGSKALQEGKKVHAHMCSTGLDESGYLRAKLVSMYAICGSVVDARLVFDKATERTLFLWNAMIRAYAKNGFSEEEVLVLYYQMKLSGVSPDRYTFSFVLKACAGLSDLQQGKEVHAHVIRSSFESDVIVASALLDMYWKCGSVESARRVFDKMSERNVVSWSSMIAGFTHSGLWKEALEFFRQMQIEGVKPNSVTCGTVLSAFGSSVDLQQGREIHAYLIRSEFDACVSVGSALIDMYSKCSRVDIAYRVFDKMPERNVVSWSAMIAGYAQNGHATEALEIFRQMQRDGVKPNLVTIGSVLPACSDLAALQQGKEIHAYIIRSGSESNAFVCGAVIGVYAKCGRMEDTRQVFDKMPKKDVVSWTAMIAGYGINGHDEEALTLFNQMQHAEMKPNEATFVAVLSVCSHAGLVAEGWQFFDSMSRKYDITPRVEHYACMVDLLGRAGHLDDAYHFIQNMPLEPDGHVLLALLNACRIHCNVEIGEQAAELLLELEPENAGNLVLLSNFYAAAGRWDDVAKVRTMMSDRGLKTRPGWSWIEVGNKVHTFMIGDKSHPQLQEIYAMLENLAGQMKKAGYMPATNFVLHDVVEEEKEYILCDHSEKLAIAFGLISTFPGTIIQVTKNLHVCGDCHSTTKFISKIVGRKIIVQDANRFHHFENGKCSCGDYW